MLEVYEQVGFDSYWSPDHILGVFHPGLWSEIPLSDLAADPDAFYDPFCYGAVVGTMTDKPFGISVTDATRRGAADLARTALTLNDLNPGGFILGIGSGEAESLVPFGYPVRQAGVDPRRRAARPAIAARHRADGRRWRRPDGPAARSRRTREAAGVGGGPRPADAPAHRRVRRRLDPGVVDDRRRSTAPSARSSPATPPLPGARRRSARCCRSCCSPRAPTRRPRCSNASRSASCSDCSPWAHMWEAHGLQHPLGNDSQGFVDVIIHDLDPDELRDIAHTIPFEMVQEVLFVGNTEELDRPVRGLCPQRTRTRRARQHHRCGGRHGRDHGAWHGVADAQADAVRPVNVMPHDPTPTARRSTR